MQPDQEDIERSNSPPETPPQENTSEGPPARPPETPIEGAGELDSDAPYGRKADGTPKAKPGRKSATAQTTARLESVTHAPPRVQRALPIAADAPIGPPVDYKALGETAATLWFNVPMPFLGEEWGPSENEPRMIADAFSRYFRATGVNDIPPGMALTLILVSYASARITRPTIKDRIVMGVTWLKARFKRG